MNPNLDKHEHALRLDEASAEPDLAAVLATAEFYRLSQRQADKVAKEIAAAIAEWKTVAQLHGLSRGEMQRMGPAFEPR